MRLFSAGALAAAIAFSLSGCFTSEEPLVDAVRASFPYEKIVYAESDKGDPMTMIHKDSYYVLQSNEDANAEMRLRFLPVGDNYYVAQAEFEEAGKARILYALLKVDFGARRVQSYLAVAPDEPVDAPGLTQCMKDAVCLENIEAYVVFAKAAIDAGRPPDVTYDILSRE